MIMMSKGKCSFKIVKFMTSASGSGVGVDVLLYQSENAFNLEKSLFIPGHESLNNYIII